MTDVTFLSLRRITTLHTTSNFHTIFGPWFFLFYFYQNLQVSLFFAQLQIFPWLSIFSNTTEEPALPKRLLDSFCICWWYCLLLNLPWQLLVKRMYTEPRQVPFIRDQEVIQMVWEPERPGFRSQLHRAGKLNSLSEPQFPHLQSGGPKKYFIKLLWRFSKIAPVKTSEYFLASLKSPLLILLLRSLNS